ncbi:hypothetical protein D3C76_995200 [compost metagenome]
MLTGSIDVVWELTVPDLWVGTTVLTPISIFASVVLVISVTIKFSVADSQVLVSKPFSETALTIPSFIL